MQALSGTQQYQYVLQSQISATTQGYVVTPPLVASPAQMHPQQVNQQPQQLPPVQQQQQQSVQPSLASFASSTASASQMQQSQQVPQQHQLFQPSISSVSTATGLSAYQFVPPVPQPIPPTAGMQAPNLQHATARNNAERPWIRPIVHPGHESQEGELVSVIVSICGGHSYDALFSQVPQIAGDGKRVATYAASDSSLQCILDELTGRPSTDRPRDIHQTLRRLVADIGSVQADSVVFNWECCSGCSSEHFRDASTVMNVTKYLLDRGHMVMFSDFSLKALIKDWKEDALGPNPFVKTSEFSNKFVLRFAPEVVKKCPSAQLQKLGELASDGKAALHAMSGTIAFSVDWRIADCRNYKCEVLTVMTETGIRGDAVVPHAGQVCEVDNYKGWAGHVLLTYESGGRLLASAGHWMELSQFDVSEENFMQAAAAFGTRFSEEVQRSMASCSTRAERRASVQAYASQMIQQSAPCSYSVSSRQVQQ